MYEHDEAIDGTQATMARDRETLLERCTSLLFALVRAAKLLLDSASLMRLVRTCCLMRAATLLLRAGECLNMTPIASVRFEQKLVILVFHYSMSDSD